MRSIVSPLQVKNMLHSGFLQCNINQILKKDSDVQEPLLALCFYQVAWVANCFYLSCHFG
uniref:Uncharacterized protein n=1 Tax=Arundo donax TaxID=35708 RepID=A0A0A9HMM9_ARUDO